MVFLCSRISWMRVVSLFCICVAIVAFVPKAWADAQLVRSSPVSCENPIYFEGISCAVIPCRNLQNVTQIIFRLTDSLMNDASQLAKNVCRKLGASCPHARNVDISNNGFECFYNTFLCVYTEPNSDNTFRCVSGSAPDLRPKSQD